MSMMDSCVRVYVVGNITAYWISQSIYEEIKEKNTGINAVSMQSEFTALTGILLLFVRLISSPKT